MNIAFIALGSNIGDREAYLKKAVEQLDYVLEVSVVRTSSIYETIPVGYTEQDDFLNMVVEVKTTYSAESLMAFCQSIEHELEREREIRFGPRTIDLDILMYNQENIETEQLIIPHPRMHERAFVLVPLFELNATLHVPGSNRTVAQLLSELREEQKGVQVWKPKSGENAFGHTES
ncbi:2-amino-4-hydroxy-6-hydroxymethyldihydropteridine pyrophosphokinase [Pontibacillus halophilus JSM 076056 = DSM 19796]|uniref:2-amino-4-hydroxy-6-hydroxymethyldihydropteridine diphosphokinase n=1 Tax=Pontibacillus halophilus JSM 076056 = DSM 19796 TaxID=1385510 RepID=A0A0A5GFW4_9BACI|nr:2-amino-4-hydroxy-6-hydroxymethyldihydropteridine diphosphokinase [Pontibacillus halophilus]KGX90108.1 2-amino-4-hydroxy-6-hydroxymethyldihydropteridine pyrophosphokinase [Pontibacillus halophilus JSM 076056 = DSM 19796]